MGAPAQSERCLFSKGDFNGVSRASQGRYSPIDPFLPSEDQLSTGMWHDLLFCRVAGRFFTDRHDTAHCGERPTQYRVRAGLCPPSPVPRADC